MFILDILFHVILGLLGNCVRNSPIVLTKPETFHSSPVRFQQTFYQERALLFTRNARNAILSDGFNLGVIRTL